MKIYDNDIIAALNASFPNLNLSREKYVNTNSLGILFHFILLNYFIVFFFLFIMLMLCYRKKRTKWIGFYY